MKLFEKNTTHTHIIVKPIRYTLHTKSKREKRNTKISIHTLIVFVILVKT